jgi:hypothetical protein
MVCSNCHLKGHNRRTCNVDQGIFGEIPRGLRNSHQLPSAEEVWVYRKNVDVYSSRVMADVIKPQVDHVLEIQLLDATYEAYLSDPNRVRHAHRAERPKLISLANCIENTNVTSQAINLSKKGPFTRAKNEWVDSEYVQVKCSGVDSYVFKKNGRRRRGKYPGMTNREWSNIKAEVVTSFESLNHMIPDAIAGRNGEIFQDYFYDMFRSLRLVD